MKRSAISLSAALIAVLALTAIFPLPAASAQGGETIRVLIEYRPGNMQALQRTLQEAGAQFHYSFENLNTFAVTLPVQALDGISRNPHVVMVEEDPLRTMISGQFPEASGSRVQLADVTDPNGQTIPFGIDMVQARDVWDADRDGVIDAGAPTGSNRTICIIDSGLHVGHEDLSGVNLLGGYPSGWNTDLFGHGTHVAGTIAAMNNTLGVVGVTPGTVNLYIVKVFGDDGAWAYASTLVDAANRCAAAGANIISMSLGGSKASTTERNAFASLFTQGILSIAAAGNDGLTIYNYPASYPSVVSVAAIDANMLVATFSNQNDQVDLAAPGVGVLSTVPYLDENFVAVDGSSYPAMHIEFSGRGSASGTLVHGGLCDSIGAWTAQVVLCERGVIDFYTKVSNVQAGGGAAALIYNNVPGNFLGTLGEGNSSSIIALSLSQEDGQYLSTMKLGSLASLSSSLIIPASGYEAWDGTSMATPHVSAVAALLWSSRPTASNTQVRDALYASAYDLGSSGRDNAYGYGLVQAQAALQVLNPPTPSNYSHVSDLDKTAAWVTNNSWKATVTISVQDALGNPVGGATVSGAWSTGATATCVTDTSGLCSVSSANLRKTVTSISFSVTNITHATLTYYPAANADPDGDSNGTLILVTRP